MNFEEVFLNFEKSEAWKRFDEWIGLSVETETGAWLCFFSQVEPDQFRFWALRGQESTERFLKYRMGEWSPELGLDFATTDGITVDIINDEVGEDWSLSPGRPPAELRPDEKRELFQCLDAVQYLVGAIDEEKIPPLGEVEEIVYRLWKVSDTWRAEVYPLPDPQFGVLSKLDFPKERMDRLAKIPLKREGIWEAGVFYLPAIRPQGDQEVFVQCAGVCERMGELLGLVTMEAHANPENEILEALLGTMEKQAYLPQAIYVRDEDLLVALSPLAQILGIPFRYRKNLGSLEHVRDSLIDDFPEDNAEEN